MTTIRIDASRAYDVRIGRGLLDTLGDAVRSVTKADTAALISDDAVFALYGERALRSLEGAGLRAVSFVFPHGEQQKTLATFGQALNFLCEHRLTRSDVVVALGGGVVGDLAGFTAACYQRGIRYVQVPTTLLAMVDSSVGGKTAVDLEAGKNQAGAFWQPSLVLCDPETLSTLPEEEFRCGCAEVIKYGVLGNEPFFRSLQERPVRGQLERVIETCVAMKRDLVAADEFDRGARRLLNLGHSFGHAVEACSGFSILHGQGVAIGMAIVARAAVRRGFCSEETAREIIETLRACGLPTETEFPAEALLAAAGSDKKMEGGTMHLVIPEAIGKCRIEAVPAEALRGWLADGGVL